MLGFIQDLQLVTTECDFTDFQGCGPPFLEDVLQACLFWSSELPFMNHNIVAYLNYSISIKKTQNNCSS